MLFRSELLTTAKDARVSTHPESFMVCEMATQLKKGTKELNLQLLGLKTLQDGLSLKAFEDAIKMIDFDDKIQIDMDQPAGSSSKESESIEAKDIAFYTSTGRPNHLRDKFRKNQVSGRRAQGVSSIYQKK